MLDEFKFVCAGVEYLDNKDFISGAISLSSAASKTGMITKDLIQYFNRILKIARKTEATVANRKTLPALYRDCWSGADPVLEGEGPWPELDYDEECELVAADIPPNSISGTENPDYCVEGTLNHCLFPDVEERFVDFSGLTDYWREGENVAVLINTSATNWDFPVVSAAPAIETSASYILEVTPNTGLSLLTWVEAVNGEVYATQGIDVFAPRPATFCARSNSSTTTKHRKFSSALMRPPFRARVRGNCRLICFDNCTKAPHLVRRFFFADF